MTGFGKGSGSTAGVTVDVEVRAVNHRFVDINCKLPRVYQEYEGALREIIAKRVERGRIEVVVSRTVSGVTKADKAIRFNRSLYKEFYSVLTSLLPAKVLKDDEVVADIMLNIVSRKEVLSAEEDSVASPDEQKVLLRACEEALARLTKMRRTEGGKLYAEIVGRVRALETLRKKIESGAAEAGGSLRNRLAARLKKISSEISVDDPRFATEVVYLSDRSDVTEELVRLASHLDQFSSALKISHNGRKLDFIIQEIGREINTIGSKIQEASVQGLVVDAKVEMEKIREQLQNVA